MRYFPRMAIIPSLGLLLAATLQPQAAGNARPLADAVGTAGVTRFSGAAANFTVSARIIRSAARIGAGFGPPARGMHPRATLVSDSDGGAVPALVFDFE